MERHEGMATEVKDQAAQVGQAAQDKAVELRHEGGQKLRHQLDERTSQLGGQARSFASTLRRTGSELEAQEGSGAASRVATGVADRLERVGGYLEGARGDDLLRDAERFARQRAWVVAGAAAAAGFAASRLLKASSERRYHESSGNGGQRAAWERHEPPATPIDERHVPQSRATVVEPGV